VAEQHGAIGEQRGIGFSMRTGQAVRAPALNPVAC
jgi:hypothetical protein